MMRHSGFVLLGNIEDAADSEWPGLMTASRQLLESNTDNEPWVAEAARNLLCMADRGRLQETDASIALSARRWRR
jgi:hypothetical protein